MNAKGVLCALLAVGCVCALAPVTVNAKESDGFTYTIENDEVTLETCTLPMDTTEIIVPDTIEGKPVTQLSERMFRNYPLVETVTLPSHLTAIPDGCFVMCDALQNVQIPDSVTEIGENAFGNCDSLQEITLPPSVQSIGRAAFYGCDALETVNIPEGVTVLDHTFGDCHSLREVALPATITTLDSAFTRCTALQRIEIPSGVEHFEDSLFDCTALESITVADDNAVFTSKDGVLFTKDEQTLLQYPLGNPRTDYVIPDSVTEIRDTAFWRCQYLANVTIPEGITELCREFYGSPAIQTVTLPKSLVRIDVNTFTQGATTDFYYAGSMVDWGKVEIADVNYAIYRATIHFGEPDNAEHRQALLYIAPDALPVPDENAAFQIETKSDTPTFKIISGNAAEVSGTGLVTPKNLEGSTIIQITDGEGVSFLHVQTQDYCPVHADAVISDFLKTHITDGMTTEEKLDAICQLPASMDYNADHWNYVEMLTYGTGNCGGSATMLVEMCRRLGIEAWVRSAVRDPNAGSAHVNALAAADGVYYELEAGYTGTAPRPYKITKRTSLCKYKDAPGGINVYQYDGKNERQTALEIPETIDGKPVVRIGDEFLKENPWVRSVELPDSVTEISESAFPDYQGILFGAEGSATEEFAKAHDIAFRATGSLATGDVNADGDIDIMDVIAVNKYLLGGSLLNQSQCVAADVDADGIVTPTDSLIILKYVVDIIDLFNP